MSYDLSSFYKYIAPDVRGCPQPVVEEAVRDAVIEFCRKTGYWRKWLDSEVSVYEDDEYAELDLPTNTRLVDVIAVQYVNNDGTYGDYLDRDSYEWKGFESAPRLLFNTPATEDYDARVRVSLAPDVDTDTVQDWVYDDFRDTICHGATARLQNMSGASWYRQKQAADHRYSFLMDTSRVAAKVAMDNVNKLAPKQTGYI